MEASGILEVIEQIEKRMDGIRDDLIDVKKRIKLACFPLVNVLDDSTIPPSPPADLMTNVSFSDLWAPKAQRPSGSSLGQQSMHSVSTASLTNAGNANPNAFPSGTNPGGDFPMACNGMTYPPFINSPDVPVTAAASTPMPVVEQRSYQQPPPPPQQQPAPALYNANSDFYMPSSLVASSPAPAPIAPPAVVSPPAVVEPFPFVDTLKFIDVKYGIYLDVQMSFVYSSRSFFCHLNYGDVQDFYIKLNRHYTDEVMMMPGKLRATNIAIKQLVCAYNPEDNRYYRAQVLKQTAGGYLVRFVDFGDTKILEAGQIYKLYEEYARAPIFGLHCYVEDSWLNDFETIDSAFLDFLQLPTSYCLGVQLNFLPRKSGIKFPVMAKIRDTNDEWKTFDEANLVTVRMADTITSQKFHFKEFADAFLSSQCFSRSAEAYQQFFAAYPDSQLAPGSEHKGFCTFYADIDMFIFSRSETIQFTTNMSFFYRDFLESRFQEGANRGSPLVVFGTKSEFYFRGYVLSTRPDSVNVLAIDLGFIYTAPFEDVYPLVELFSLKNVPVKAATCSLSNIDLIRESWSSVAIHEFESFVTKTHFTMVNKFYDKVHVVTVRKSGTKSIVYWFYRFNLASRDTSH